MQPIPYDILKQFDAVLEEKAIPVSLRDDYPKWLRYYLDFRVKYPPPDASPSRCASRGWSIIYKFLVMTHQVSWRPLRHRGKESHYTSHLP